MTKTVTIVIPFTFHHSDDTLEAFTVGTYDLPDEIASNPYVLWHSNKRPYTPPKPGTPEAAHAEFRRKQRKELLERAAEFDDDPVPEPVPEPEPILQPEPIGVTWREPVIATEPEPEPVPVDITPVPAESESVEQPALKRAPRRSTLNPNKTGSR